MLWDYFVATKWRKWNSESKLINANESMHFDAADWVWSGKIVDA